MTTKEGLDKVTKFFSIGKVLLSAFLACITFIVWLLSMSADVIINEGKIKSNRKQIEKLELSLEKHKEKSQERRDNQSVKDIELIKAMSEMATEARLLKQRLDQAEKKDN